MICFPFLRQFGAPDVFFPGAPACTWNCSAPLSSFSPSIWRPWRFLPWSPCLHLKLYGASLVIFSVNLAPLTFSSLEPLLAFETAWRPSRPFLRQFGAPDIFFPGAPACTWNCMTPLSSFSPSIWRPWRFLPWSPCLHLKLQCTPLVLFSVNLAPLTFSFQEPLLALETVWRISCHFLRQFGAPDVFFPGAPACTWNCMAPLSSFFSVNLTPLTFSSLEPLLALKTAWRPSRPFLRQFGAPDIFFPGAPACTWNCMTPLSSFSPSIWRPWRFLPWSPCLHLKLQCTPLVLFSVNLAPLTFSFQEPLLALETVWRISCHFLRQFGAPDVFFPGAPACTWNCMAPLSSFFSVNLTPLTFSSLEPLLALKTAWRPSRPFLRQFGAPDIFFPGAPACTWNCMAPLSSYWFNFLSFFFLSCALFLPFFLSYSLLFLFFLLFFPSLSFPFLFCAPLVTPGGPGPQSPPKIRPCQRSVSREIVIKKEQKSVLFLIIPCFWKKKKKKHSSN